MRELGANRLPIEVRPRGLSSDRGPRPEADVPIAARDLTRLVFRSQFEPEACLPITVRERQVFYLSLVVDSCAHSPGAWMYEGSEFDARGRLTPLA